MTVFSLPEHHTMFALRQLAPHEDPIIQEIPVPNSSADSARIHLRAAALNHRDIWIKKGLYARLQFPFTPGSDGAGYWDDQPVIINPGLGWGREEAYQNNDFHILGMPTDGTFAQEVVVPRSQVYPMPEHMSFEEAAAIPLAGVTAFRATVTQGSVTSGDRVLVTGIGGGVAQWAFRFANALGADVWVTSGTEEKIDRAVSEGAQGGFNYRQENWIDDAKSTGGFDLVIDGAAGAGCTALLKACRHGARFVIYGGTTGSIPKLNPQNLFWKQIRLQGTTMGSPSDFARMLALINEKHLTPLIDTQYALHEGAMAYQRMEEGQQMGKIILQIPPA